MNKGFANIQNLFNYYARVVVVLLLATSIAIPVHAQEDQDILTAPTLLDAVDVARSFLKDLESSESQTFRTHVMKPTENVAPIVFAVWDKESQDIVVVRGAKSGKHFVMNDHAPFTITVRQDRGVDSLYAIVPEHYIIVGALAPSVSTIKKVVKRRKKIVSHELHFALVTPVSKEFYTSEVFKQGYQYLSDTITASYDQLRSLNIHSLYIPDKLVTDVIDPYLLESIIVSEHTSHKTITKPDAAGSIESFLVEMALYQGQAYNQSLSRAGARGLVQFIPSTYKRIVAKRSEYKLIPDFVKGMNDHRNAVKAQVALLDRNLLDMPASLQRKYDHNIKAIGEYLAATYNAGTVRVNRALAIAGDQWSQATNTRTRSVRANIASVKKEMSQVKVKLAQQHSSSEKKNLNTRLHKQLQQLSQLKRQLASVKRGGLRPETVNYVAKLKKAYAMLTSGLYGSLSTSNLQSSKRVAPSSPTAVTLAAKDTAENEICFSDGGCTQANVPSPAPSTQIIMSSPSVPQPATKAAQASDQICFSDGGCVTASGQ